MATNRTLQRLRLDAGRAGASEGQEAWASAGEAVTVTYRKDGSFVVNNAETGVRFEVTAYYLEMSSPERTLRITDRGLVWIDPPAVS